MESGAALVNIKNLLQVLHGITGEPERWKLCVSYANDNMGFAVGRLFVENHFNDNSKQKVREFKLAALIASVPKLLKKIKILRS